MLQIVYKNNNIETWQPEEYTEYEYMNSVFVVFKDEQWVGIYNMSEIRSIKFIEA